MKQAVSPAETWNYVRSTLRHRRGINSSLTAAITRWNDRAEFYPSISFRSRRIICNFIASISKFRSEFSYSSINVDRWSIIISTRSESSRIVAILASFRFARNEIPPKNAKTMHYLSAIIIASTAELIKNRARKKKSGTESSPNFLPRLIAT